MKETIPIALGIIAATALLIGGGFLLKSCNETEKDCAIKTYDACQKAGGHECSLASAKLCGVTLR